MPNWDIFHSDRMEVERNLSADQVRQAVTRGDIVPGDLARPAGSGATWTRLAEHAELAAIFKKGKGQASAPTPAPPPAGPSDAASLRDMIGDDDGDDAAGDFDEFEDDEPAPATPPTTKRPLRPALDRVTDAPTLPSGVRKGTTEDLDPTGFPDSYDRDLDLNLRDARHSVNLQPEEEGDDYDPEDEDDEAAEFTFTRGGAETVEELDLAAMVDVAFQLVLFFLVTASTVVFKALEVPKPKPEEGKASAQQTLKPTMDDLAKDYILVEIDANGAVKIDHENGPNDFNGLVNRLRDIRTATSRNAMLLTADLATPHKNAVLAYDAANEIGLSIAIAQPKAAPEKPAVPPAAPK